MDEGILLLQLHKIHNLYGCFLCLALLVSNAMAPTARHSILEEDARKLREIISRLTLLRVDHTEHACLKALVLFKAGN